MPKGKEAAPTLSPNIKVMHSATLPSHNQQGLKEKMSSTSKKHQSFCSEPMRGKPIYTVPGIGQARGSQLQYHGYHKATDMLGKYLSVNENRNEFQGWLHNQSGANVKEQRDCYKAMREWCDNNL